MGMGYGSNYSDTIEQATVEEKCPINWAKFVNALVDEDLTLGEYAQNAEIDDLEEGLESTKIYVELVKEFRLNTALDLYLRYHDSQDQGDRYDDVDGEFWAVDGAWEMSKAGKSLEDKIERKFFVTFG